MVYDKLTDPDAPMQLGGIPPKDLLTDAFLRRLAPDVRQVGKDG